MLFVPEYEESGSNAVIKVIGIGGGGGNAVNHMVTEGEATQDLSRDSMNGVEFFAVNTDAQALRKSSAQRTIQIGGTTTKGLGAGANPAVGRKAAEDDKDAIREVLKEADMVFLAAGMGGGTGTGAAPVVAQIAKEMGILTVGVVTKPFSFEGKKRMQLAEIGIQELSNHVDSLIIIPNEKLLKVLGKNVTLLQAFSSANDVLRNAVRGISDMITSPGMINVDFADVCTVMSAKGRAMMGTGVATGEAGSDRAEKAARSAIASPLLEDIDLSGAKGVLVNVAAGLDLGLEEFTIIGNMVEEFAASEATVVVGTTLLPEIENEIRVTIVATGIGEALEPEIKLNPTAPVLNEQHRQESATANAYENHLGAMGQNNQPQATEPAARRPATLDGNTFNPADLKMPAYMRHLNQK